MSSEVICNAVTPTPPFAPPLGRVLGGGLALTATIRQAEMLAMVPLTPAALAEQDAEPAVPSPCELRPPAAPQKAPAVAASVKVVKERRPMTPCVGELIGHRRRDMREAQAPMSSAERLLRNIAPEQPLPPMSASVSPPSVTIPPALSEATPTLPFALRRLANPSSLAGLRMEAVHICDFVDTAKIELESAVNEAYMRGLEAGRLESSAELARANEKIKALTDLINTL